MVFGGQRGHAVSKVFGSRDLERCSPQSRWSWTMTMCSSTRRRWRSGATCGISTDSTRVFLDSRAPTGEVLDPAGQRRSSTNPPPAFIHVHTESWAQVRHRFHREGIAGRWTAVRIIRHIPGEILAESIGCLDLFLATLRGRLPSLAGEILRYRYNKTVGVVKGILDSRVITNPSKRAELHFDKGFPAVVIRGGHSAAIEPRSIPALKPSEVLVRVAYEGICATDLEIFEGRLGYYKSGMAKSPIVPGHEVSGTIAFARQEGGGPRGGRPGRRGMYPGCGACDDCKRDSAITCKERREVGVIEVDGGYAEYLVTRARYVRKVPDDVTLAQAALAEPLAVAIKGLRRLEASAPSADPNAVRSSAPVPSATLRPRS